MLREREGDGSRERCVFLGPAAVSPQASFHRDSSAVMRQISYIHRNARPYFPSFGVGRLLGGGVPSIQMLLFFVLHL